MSQEVNVSNIENLEQILGDVVDVSKLKHTEITRLTAPGEHYGSVMLRLDLVMQSDNNDEEKVFFVAKKIPSDEILQKNFNIQVTFKNEVAMYQTIVPTLQNFQKEYNIRELFDCLPKFYYARYNLNESDTVDENAVIILENLNEKGYSNVDRMLGFNLTSIKLILKDLAEFHAVPLALKLKKPDIFEQKLKIYCNEFIFDKEFHKMFREIVKNIILENENCADLASRVHFLGDISRPAVKEPFGTLTHADLWCNNTMQKFTEEQVAVCNRFLDFQFLSYGSPVCDLIFLLFTSVQTEVLKTHLDDLIEWYHTQFVDVLKKLNCDTSSFSLNNFLEEIKRQCPFEIGHTINFVLFIVNASKRGKELKLPEDCDKLSSEVVTPVGKERIWLMLEECNKRGWI